MDAFVPPVRGAQKERAKNETIDIRKQYDDALAELEKLQGKAKQSNKDKRTIEKLERKIEMLKEDLEDKDGNEENGDADEEEVDEDKEAFFARIKRRAKARLNNFHFQCDD